MNLRRTVRTVSAVADIVAFARFTPLGLAVTAAKALEAWWDNKPGPAECVEGWVRADPSPCWPLALRKARATAARIAADTYQTGFEADVLGVSVRWLESSWEVEGPFLRPTSEQPDVAEYLWPGDHAVLEARDDEPCIEQERSDIDQSSPLAEESAAELAKMLRAGKRRGEIFWGSSGQGKSVAARCVARLLDGRSLAVRASELEQLNELIRALAPDVVILHDIHIDPPHHMAIERLRGSVKVVIATTTQKPDPELTRCGRFERLRELPPPRGLPIASEIEYQTRCDVLGGTEAERMAWLTELWERSRPDG